MLVHCVVCVGVLLMFLIDTLMLVSGWGVVTLISVCSFSAGVLKFGCGCRGDYLLVNEPSGLNRGWANSNLNHD